MCWLLLQILMRLSQRVEAVAVRQYRLPPEDLVKNLPKAMSNMFGAGAGVGTFGNSPTFKITMKEYEDMAIKVGDRVGIEIKKVDGNGVTTRSKA